MSEPLPPAKPKRGRRPLGLRPLDPAERKRASRQRMAEAGEVEITVRLDRATLSRVDALVEGTDHSRSDVIRGLLFNAAARFELTLDVSRLFDRLGVPLTDIERLMDRVINCQDLADEVSALKAQLKTQQEVSQAKM